MSEKALHIAKTIINQIRNCDPEILFNIKAKNISPVLSNKERKGGIILHLPNDVKMLIELTWLGLYDIKLFDNVDCKLEKDENDFEYYTGEGRSVYSFDGCYLDMIGVAIETAVSEIKEPKDHKRAKAISDIFKNTPFSDN